jgi:hypothetical protein
LQAVEHTGSIAALNGNRNFAGQPINDALRVNAITASVFANAGNESNRLLGEATKGVKDRRDKLVSESID